MLVFKLRSRRGGGLLRGDEVELRSPTEILATLDEHGCFEGVPFMPEMLRYFGGRYTVLARVERACDTIYKTGARRMPSTVLLDDLRCDGAAHEGCQAACRIYWKEAWLRRVSGKPAAPQPVSDDAYAELERRVARNTRASGENGEVFRCQATEFFRATEKLDFWDVHSFLNEVRCGNVGALRFVRVTARALLEEIGLRLKIFSNRPFRHQDPPTAPADPAAPVGLRPGDRVRVRSRTEIGETLNAEGKNRGLWFDREMLPYCGETHIVGDKVVRFIDERTGEMRVLKSDCYILEGVVCRGYLSYGRWFCQRAIYPWWREAWLEQGAAEDAASAPPGPPASPPA